MHSNMMPEPPPLTPLNAEEQHLYLSSPSKMEPISKAEPSHSIHYHDLFALTLFFDDPHLVSIGEWWNVDKPVN